MTSKVAVELKRITGIFTAPGKTLSSAMRKKTWVTALLLIVLVCGAAAWLNAPAQMKKSSELMQQSRFSDYFSEEQFAPLSEPTALNRMLAAAWVIVIRLLAVCIVAFLLYLFYGIGGVEGQYSNFFSITVNAAIIGTAIPEIIKTTGTAIHFNLLSWFSPGSWLGLFISVKSFLVQLLSQMDIFTVWFLWAVAAGIAEYSELNRKKSFFIAGGYLIFKSIILGAFSYFSIQALG